MFFKWEEFAQLAMVNLGILWIQHDRFGSVPDGLIRDIQCEIFLAALRQSDDGIQSRKYRNDHRSDHKLGSPINPINHREHYGCNRTKKKKNQARSTLQDMS